jgi:hypothetical protein
MITERDTSNSSREKRNQSYEKVHQQRSYSILGSYQLGTIVIPLLVLMRLAAKVCLLSSECQNKLRTVWQRGCDKRKSK